MEAWEIKSNPIKQFLLTGVFFIIGALLMLKSYDFDASGLTPSLSAFLIGAFLVGISISALFSTLKQTILVDPVARAVIITNVSIFGTKEESIPFNTIDTVRTAFLGRASNIVLQSHYVSLTLKDGSHRPLFFPTFFDGRGSASVAQERCRRLEEYLRHTPPPHTV